MAGLGSGSMCVTLSGAKGTISSMAPFAPLRVTARRAMRLKGPAA